MLPSTARFDHRCRLLLFVRICMTFQAASIRLMLLHCAGNTIQFKEMHPQLSMAALNSINCLHLRNLWANMYASCVIRRYIIQCRRLGKQHGARPSAREWVIFARAAPTPREESNHLVHVAQLSLLLPSTDYSFRVIAESLAGCSEPSNPCPLWRTAAYPRVTGLQVSYTF